MRVAEFVRNTLVGSATVPVVVTKDPSRVPESPANRDGVRIVVSENPGSRRIVQCQRISYAVRDGRRNSHAPRLDLDPISVALIEDLAVEIEECVDTAIQAIGHCISS